MFRYLMICGFIVHLFFPSLLSAAESLVIRDIASSDEFNVPVEIHGDVPCFSLSRFSDIMGLIMVWDYVDGTVEVTFRDHVVRFAAEMSEFNLNGEILFLNAPVVQTPNDVWMPLNCLDHLAIRTWEGELTWNPDQGEILILSQNKSPTEEMVSGDTGYIIVLDPGHGGDDAGCELPDSRMEKEITLRLCDRLERILEDRLGAEVILTRSGDYSVDVVNRTVMANVRQADLFLSVHFAPSKEMFNNSFCLYRYKGAESAYTIKAALLMWEEQEAGTGDRVSEIIQIIGDSVSSSARNKNWVTRNAGLAVLKGLSVPGIVIEISDETAFYGQETITRSAGLNRAVEALFDGLKAFMESGQKK